MHAGERLKEIRERLGLSTRDVAALSQIIVAREGNEEFSISSSWLTQIENERECRPTIERIFPLACIYGLSCEHILLWYGVDIRKAAVYHSEMPGKKTHLLQFNGSGGSKPIEIPSQVSAALDLNQTSLLPQMLGPWANVPSELLHDFDLRYHRYGYIGLKDYTLYPLITPGSFVAIDPELTRVRRVHAHNEYERPIYFLDLRKLRKEYACGWCDLVDRKLVLIPHSLSNLQTRMFAFPSEAEIIGQVTGVAMRIGLPPE
jgi:transcriptional regulator with XRE-family HTH domain